MKLEIKKGIPLPDLRTKGPRDPLARELMRLEVGDCAEVPLIEKKGTNGVPLDPLRVTRSEVRRITQIVRYHTGGKYAMRVVDGRVTVWRIS